MTTTSFAGGTGKSRTPRSWKSVLLVTSHPDDESMFFGPTIQAAKRMGAQVHILCLSTGDADGLGEVRAKELDSAGAHLGVTSVDLVDDSALRDGFDEKWPVEAVAARVDVGQQQARLGPVRRWEAQRAPLRDAQGHREGSRERGRLALEFDAARHIVVS